jgi:hypothetical protein
MINWNLQKKFIFFEVFMHKDILIDTHKVENQGIRVLLADNRQGIDLGYPAMKNGYFNSLLFFYTFLCSAIKFV